jgi:hypothetical protein
MLVDKRVSDLLGYFIKGNEYWFMCPIYLPTPRAYKIPYKVDSITFYKNSTTHTYSLYVDVTLDIPPSLKDFWDDKISNSLKDSFRANIGYSHGLKIYKYGKCFINPKIDSISVYADLIKFNFV